MIPDFAMPDGAPETAMPDGAPEAAMPDGAPKPPVRYIADTTPPGTVAERNLAAPRRHQPAVGSTREWLYGCFPPQALQ